MILADVGVKTSTMVVDKIKAEAREKKIGDPKQVKQMLIDILVDMMKDTDLRFPAAHRADGNRRKRRGQDHHHRQARHALSDTSAAR